MISPFCNLDFNFPIFSLSCLGVGLFSASKLLPSSPPEGSTGVSCCSHRSIVTERSKEEEEEEMTEEN